MGAREDAYRAFTEAETVRHRHLRRCPLGSECNHVESTRRETTRRAVEAEDDKVRPRQ